MATLKVTIRGHGPVTFQGPRDDVEALSVRVREAMTQTVDTVISHDLAQEPRSFLVSEIVDIHPVEAD